MSFTVTVKPSFLSDLVRTPRRITNRMTQVTEELQQNPLRGGGNVKKLLGHRSFYRYRIDDYRLVYAVNPRGRVVELMLLGPRKNIYERFPAAPDLPDQPLEAVEVEPELDDSHLEAVTVPAVEHAPAPSFSKCLPRFSADDLAAWQIPLDFHATLLACQSEDDLLDSDVPERWKLRLMDVIFPRPIAEVAEQPSLAVQRPQDLEAYVEGRLTDFLLQLDGDQEALVDRSLQGPAMVKGGPGSGKSTVALYRAKALLEGGYAGAGGTALFTTYTNALKALSEQLLEQLLGHRPRNVDVRTTDSLAMAILTETRCPMPRAASTEDRRKALDRARASLGSGADDLEAFLEAASLDTLPVDYLLEEFDWVIEGQGLSTLEEYEAVSRSGRGVRLDRPLRRRVWALHRAWKEDLARKHLATWGEIRSRALQAIQTGRASRLYDYVLVDEAQDLSPVALRLCVAVCRDPRGLFLAADAGQSLYNRGFSWARVHESLRFQGRARLLKRNYRSTRALGLAAADVLRAHGVGDPETLDQQFVREGPPPRIEVCANRLQEFRWLAEEVRQAARDLRLSPAAAAVLCPTRRLGEEAVAALTSEGLKAELVEGRNYRLDSPTVKVMTMHSAKGLEFPIVALPAVERDLMPSPLPSGDDPGLHEQAQRRLFHVAVSRAMRHLLVATRRGAVSPFLEDLDRNLWDWNEAE